ncbi:hypothetical protein [Rhodococcus sp. X156]|nr:hypothetical protein [Rhodococcus sp. X156]
MPGENFAVASLDAWDIAAHDERLKLNTPVMAAGFVEVRTTA